MTNNNIDIEKLREKQEFFKDFFDKGGKAENNGILNVIHHDKIQVSGSNKAFLSKLGQILSDNRDLYNESTLENQINAMKNEIRKLSPQEQLSVIRQIKQRNEERKRQFRETLKPTEITTNSFNDKYTLNLNEQRAYIENEMSPILKESGLMEVFSYGQMKNLDSLPMSNVLLTEVVDHYADFKNVARVNDIETNEDYVTQVYEKYAPFFLDSLKSIDYIQELEAIEMNPRMTATDKEHAAQMLVLNLRQFEGEENAETIFDKRKNFMIENDPYEYYRSSYQAYIDTRQVATRESYGMQEGKRDGKARFNIPVHVVNHDTYRRARFLRSKYIVPSIANANSSLLSSRRKMNDMLNMHRYDQYLLMKRDWTFTSRYRKKMHTRRVNRRHTISRLFKTLEQFKW
eukprot:CAMPEP_0117424596 /NCGR_PEP_ID=MMETSP0758-20121206/4981_1 /TAXON_ID=63605 /ORGANISM="Percolomonas cosmopolitus, Strain AE-1 (ATCC 50343)" /LENGTH=401 /DNA_ID=CAMNT_0005208465 /DNA_START=118 /DNA_END=1320 /DNA_ORIENTATION=-